MSFELRVEFSGLCLYVPREGGQAMAVLMPDCRRSQSPTHDDDTTGVAHVGYLRYNLANAQTGVPAGNDSDGPQYEVVHRFDREQLDFGLPAEPLQTTELNFPDFSQFAPALEPIPDLFSAAPPTVLLTRMTLNGGELKGVSPGDIWELPADLNPRGQQHRGQFSSFAVWTRRVAADQLKLQLTGFDGTATSITLRPVTNAAGESVVSLKIANLCDKNPLEWPELETRGVIGPDVDFKWLYRLLQPRTRETFRTLLKRRNLPVPHPSPGDAPRGERDDCMGGQISGAAL